MAPRGFIPWTTDQMKAAGKTCGPVMYDGAGHCFMRAVEDTANTNPDNTKARNEAFKRWLELMKKI